MAVPFVAMGGRVMREWVAVEAPERILPTLFYILTLLAYFTHHAGILFVVLAWVFVIFRLLHAYVHVTSNIANLRGMLFGLGSVVLAVMWVIFIIQVLAQP